MKLTDIKIVDTVRTFKGGLRFYYIPSFTFPKPHGDRHINDSGIGIERKHGKQVDRLPISIFKDWLMDCDCIPTKENYSKKDGTLMNFTLTEDAFELSDYTRRMQEFFQAVGERHAGLIKEALRIPNDLTRKEFIRNPNLPISDWVTQGYSTYGWSTGKTPVLRFAFHLRNEYTGLTPDMHLNLMVRGVYDDAKERFNAEISKTLKEFNVSPVKKAPRQLQFNR